MGVVAALASHCDRNRLCNFEMIELIIFKEDHKCFAANSGVVFKPGVNLVVGDQGCGKSTLLAQIDYYNKAQKAKREKRKFSSDVDKCKIDLLWRGGQKKFGYFDFEKHNPRTQPAFGMGLGYDTGFQIASMFSSHGESVIPLLFGLTGDCKNAVAILDEPDMALSSRSIHRLIKDLKKIDEDGSSQIILSAHNPLLIAAFSEVCSLEHGRWMSGSEFLELEATTEAPKYDNKKSRLVKIHYGSKQKKDEVDIVVDKLLG